MKKHWLRRASAISLLATIAIAAVEVISSTVGKRDLVGVKEDRQPEASRVLVYFPALATDAAISSVDFLRLFGNTSTLLVDYPKSGYNREAIFTGLIERLKDYQGKELVIYGVSLGAGIALDFRRYLLAHPESSTWFPAAKFVLYSPVTGLSDVNLRSKLAAGVGYLIRGGLISGNFWTGFFRYRMFYSGSSGFRSGIVFVKLQQVRAALEQVSLRRLSSELRAVYEGHGSRLGEFASDSALIFIFGEDSVVKRMAPRRLAKAFGIAVIVEVLPRGHADIARAISDKMSPAIAEFLEAV